MSQYDRRYDGIPHPEAKRMPVDPPHSKLQPRKSGTHQKPVKKGSVWNMRWDNKPKERGWYWWVRSWYCPHVGTQVHGYMHGRLDHVVQRMRGLLLEDRATGVYFMVAQHDRSKQISPEFSSYENVRNWLVFEGLRRGYLLVKKVKNWEGESFYRLDEK